MEMCRWDGFTEKMSNFAGIKMGRNHHEILTQVSHVK